MKWRKRIGWLLIFAMILSLAGCSSGEKTVGGLNLDQAEPLLCAAAEAVVCQAGGAGFEAQPSAAFFTDLVTCALRDGALTAQNSPFTTPGANTFRIGDENQQALYDMLFAVGTHPGFTGAAVSVKPDSVTVQVVSRHPLMPAMRFDIIGVAQCSDYENALSLTAQLCGENETTGAVDYGKYTLVVVKNDASPFGCTLAAVRAQSSILAPASAAPTAPADSAAPQNPGDDASAGSDAPEQDGAAGTEDSGNAGDAPAQGGDADPLVGQTDPLTAFFGYAAVDALEDWSPVMRAVADACMKLEYNLEGEPDETMFWSVLGGAVHLMGSQLPGVSLQEDQYVMVRDDVVMTMQNLFALPPQDVPEIPEDLKGFVSLENGVYAFGSVGVEAFHVTQYQAVEGGVLFTLSDAQNHRVTVKMIENPNSGYGVSIESAQFMP